MEPHHKFVKLSLCSWHTLPVPPMIQLAQLSHASSLNSIRVLLPRTTCAADDAAGAISARLESLLDLCSPGRHELCHQYCSLYSLQTPRAFTRPGFCWQARMVPLIMKLVQFLNASGLYSTRVLLVGTNCATNFVACTASKRLGLYSALVLRAGTNCAADTAARAVSERVESSLAPCSADRRELCHQYCAAFQRFSLYSTRVLLADKNCAVDTTACAVSEDVESSLALCSTGRHEPCHRRCSWCIDDSTHDIPGSTVP